MLKNIPRTFLVLLSIFFLIEILGAISFPLMFVQVGFHALVVWWALSGNRYAAYFLVLIFSISILSGLYGAFSSFQSQPIQASIELVVVALLVSLIGYLLLNSKMRQLYLKKDVNQWNP